MPRLCCLFVLVAVLVACGDDERAASPTTEPQATTSTTDADTQFPCGPERTDCSPEEVIATLKRLYVIGGATRAEADCLAPLTGEDVTSVAEATEAPTREEMEDGIECVGGSQERLVEIARGVAAYFESSEP